MDIKHWIAHTDAHSDGDARKNKVLTFDNIFIYDHSCNGHAYEFGRDGIMYEDTDPSVEGDNGKHNAISKNDQVNRHNEGDKKKASRKEILRIELEKVDAIILEQDNLYSQNMIKFEIVRAHESDRDKMRIVQKEEYYELVKMNEDIESFRKRVQIGKEKWNIDIKYAATKKLCEQIANLHKNGGNDEELVIKRNEFERSKKTYLDDLVKYSKLVEEENKYIDNYNTLNVKYEKTREDFPLLQQKTNNLIEIYNAALAEYIAMKAKREVMVKVYNELQDKYRLGFTIKPTSY